MKKFMLTLAISASMSAAIADKKITKEFLESEVASGTVEYQRLAGTLTHCTITTKSGFVFTGESACADPESFNEELGKKFAYEKAFESMWMPYGFWLKQILYHQENDDTDSVGA